MGSGEAQAHEQVVPVSERAVHALRPAGFENAARKEHHNEAAALRNIHEQGVCLASLSEIMSEQLHVPSAEKPQVPCATCIGTYIACKSNLHVSAQVPYMHIQIDTDVNHPKCTYGLVSC